MNKQNIRWYYLNLQRPSRELSIEEILTYTFDIYSRNFAVFVIPLLIASLISGMLSVPILSYVSEISQIDFTGPLDVVWSQLWNFILTLLASALLLSIISWILGSVISGVCVKSASDLIERGKASLRESFNFTIYKLPSLLIATLIAGIFTVLGLIALIVPGIIISIMFYLVVPVIMIENMGALDSLSRSGRLVNNRWLITFVIALIMGLVIGIAALILNFIMAPLGIYRSLAGSLIIALVEPIFPISLTVYYYSLLAKEQQQRIPPPPPPPS
jgi:hypothetical protein